MTWNYRIIRHHHPAGDYFALHEVYYGDAGKLDGYTADPIDFMCDIEEGPEAIARSLEIALADAKRHPVLDIAEFGPDDDPPRLRNAKALAYIEAERAKLSD